MRFLKILWELLVVGALLVVGTFTYITIGGAIHTHTLQRVGSFTYITEGGVIHIYYRGWGQSHILQRVGSFTYTYGGGGSRFALVRQAAK